MRRASSQRAAARKRKKRETWQRAVAWICYHVAWIFATNNRRCLLLWIFALVLFVAAFASGPGEPVLVRLVGDQIASAERTIKAQNPWWWGSVTAIQPQQGPSLFWSWWPLTRFFLVLTAAFLYTLIASREEAAEAWIRALAWLQEREDEETQPRGATPPRRGTTPQPPVSARTHSFWRLLRIDLAAEFIGEFVRLITSSIVQGARRS